jgi:Tfp pilus assembly protein PilF
MNRREDGLAEVRKALELEPFSLVFNRMVAFSLTNSEKDEEAIAQYRKTIDLFPDDATTKVDFAYFLATRKEYAEALRNVIEGLRLEGLKAKWLEKIQTAAKIDGWEGYRKVMAEYGEEQKRVTGHYSSFQLALDYAATGDLDKAFDLLDQAFEERDVRLPSFRQSDELKDYQNDPRFRALEKKMGFPE